MSESISTRVSCGTPIAYKGGGGSYLNDSIESDWYLYECKKNVRHIVAVLCSAGPRSGATYCRTL